MGENRKYYYIKEKSKISQSEVSNNKPQVIFQPLISGIVRTQDNESVLDLNFKVKEYPKLWISLLNWGIFFTILVVIYFLGVFLNIGGDYIKSDIIRKGEVASINLQKGASSLLSLNLDDALRNFNLARRNFDAALTDFESLGQGYLLAADLDINRSQIFQGQALMDGGYHLAIASENIINAFKPIIQYWDNNSVDGLDKVGSELGKILLDSSKYIDKALIEIELADSSLQKLDSKYVPVGYADLVEEAKDKTKSLNQALEISGIIAKQLPIALGFDNPRYYLLLNQNYNEIRATGGFIGSYVFLEVYKGKLETVFVDDIHRLDGQNKYNDMELPEPLKAVTAYYGMRDANWEPDFPTSVRTIQKLYEQAGGGTVDGIFALTPDVISGILSVIGPIYMPEYDIQLTAENFVEKTQKHVEIDAQGNYNPKQLLVDVAPIIVNKLLAIDSQQLNLIGKKILTYLITKDILINFSDSQLESVISKLNWGGEISQIASKEDYLYIVESNLGGNKSSGSMVREISHDVKINSNGTTFDILNIKYTHEGTEEYPDGINKNYIRIYLPAGVRVTSASGYDTNTQIDTDTINGKTVIGFWVTTTPKESTEIKLEYFLPFRFDDEYILTVQKQPGIRRTRLQSQVEFNKDKEIIFADQLDKDLTLNLSLE